MAFFFSHRGHSFLQTRLSVLTDGLAAGAGTEGKLLVQAAPGNESQLGRFEV